MRRSARGWSRRCCTRSAWHASWYATRSNPGRPAGRSASPSSWRSSITSRTFVEKARASSFGIRSPSCCRCAPQPAAFVTTTSTPANARRLRSASARAVSSRPLWAARAPQHDLRARDDHAPPVPRQHPDRREVHPAEPSILHAAAQQRDGPALLADGRRFAREAAEQRGTLRGERADAFREREARERLHRRGEPQQLLPRQRDVEPEPPEEPRPSRPQRLHLDACTLDHPSERHVRRTDVLARAAGEAEIHEARERLVGFGRARRRPNASP